jgi:hypothetical protein
MAPCQAVNVPALCATADSSDSRGVGGDGTLSSAAWRAALLEHHEAIRGAALGVIHAQGALDACLGGGDAPGGRLYDAVHRALGARLRVMQTARPTVDGTVDGYFQQAVTRELVGVDALRLTLAAVPSVYAAALVAIDAHRWAPVDPDSILAWRPARGDQVDRAPYTSHV